MKVADTIEDRLKAQYTEQLHKLGCFDTRGMTLYQLASRLARERRIRGSEDINHDSSENVWFE